MYGGFEIYPAKLMELSDEYTSMANQLKLIVKRLNSLKNNLPGSSFENIKAVLNSTITNIEDYSKGIENLKTGLNNSVKSYLTAENNIIQTQITFNGSNPGKPSESSNDNKTKDNLLEMLWSFLDSAGSVPSSAAPYIQMLLSGITGEEIDATIIASILASTVNKYAFFADVAENGWKEALKNGFGIGAYMPEGTTAGETFTDYFKQAIKSEADGFVDSSTAAKTASSVAKWAGVALTTIVEGVENYEEYQNGEISGGRAVTETIIETGTDVAMGAAATAATGALLAAAGVAAAPAVAVAGVATVAVAGVNWVTETLTGKDVGEWVSDTVCDVGESVGNWFKSLWN